MQQNVTAFQRAKLRSYWRCRLHVLSKTLTDKRVLLLTKLSRVIISVFGDILLASAAKAAIYILFYSISRSSYICERPGHSSFTFYLNAVTFV